MLLRNNAARLVTINGAFELGQRTEAYQVKPGDNPAVEVPDELCENAFVKALIKDGTLTALTEAKPVIDVEAEPSFYDGMNKADLISLCDSREIETSSRDTVKTLTGKLEAHDAE